MSGIHDTPSEGTMAMIAQPAFASGTAALVVNGIARTVSAVDPDKPLVFVLRDELGLRGTKVSCGHGQCGACAVLIDGVEARACTTALVDVLGRDVTTVEGLRDRDVTCRLRDAIVVEQASQCGYCLPGMVVAATALLARDADPSEEAIADALEPHLCRCGTYGRVVRAVRRAAHAGAVRP
jgi:aerobic-type carbon monoxide dehydrogenase small subunit (CoxS/CutS family)